MLCITPLPLHLSILHKNPKFIHTRATQNQHSTTPFTVRSTSTVKEIEKPIGKQTEVEGGLSSKLGEAEPFPPIRAAKRVVLVRHGQSTWNEEGRIQGSSDFSVLTAKGESQAETSRLMLIDDAFDICFSSPLIRSKRTAEIIWSARKEEIITDADLREIDLYSFQGLLKHEGKAKFGSAFLQWQIDASNFNIDGHYPVRELWARARNCWTKILNHESRSVLVVAHNAVNQALVATAIGLGTEYFRILLQSNCGVSVLDFTPRIEGGSPNICLNRLNQTPNSPVAGSSAGRKTSKRIVLVCHGFSQGNSEASIPCTGDTPMNMLGIIQSQKTAELLLDLKVSAIVSSPKVASVETANVISRIQEAADCLGADCVPRYVELKQLQDLDVESILQQSNKDATEVPCLQSSFLNGYKDEVKTEIWDQLGQAWKSLLQELSTESESENIVVAVGHPVAHIALMGHCLNLTKEWMGSFHLDAGSISVIDFPDGPAGRGVIRCINYTAHLGRWSIPITRSALEENNELGIAHMLEHLAFTAVEFKDPDVKKYLETLLTSGGPCKSLGLTGYDFTLYSFPAKNEKELTQAISVLAGISSEVKVCEENLEKERGVVMDEYNKKYDDVHYRQTAAVMSLRYSGTKYEQLTIGKAEIIKGVSAETVNNFYRKWYQLPQMSIVIVGDTDSESTVNLISTFFGSKEPDLGTKEPDLGIPPFREPHISCFGDSTI